MQGRAGRVGCVYILLAIPFSDRPEVCKCKGRRESASASNL